MAKKKPKRAGSSKAGRPEKEGPRLANGRLAPPGPNERVAELRKALLGDRSSTSPLHPTRSTWTTPWASCRCACTGQHWP